jgi:hypothetical protein
VGWPHHTIWNGEQLNVSRTVKEWPVRKVRHGWANAPLGVVLKWCISFTHYDSLPSRYVLLSHTEYYFTLCVEEIMAKPYTDCIPFTFSLRTMDQVEATSVYWTILPEAYYLVIILVIFLKSKSFVQTCIKSSGATVHDELRPLLRLLLCNIMKLLSRKQSVSKRTKLWKYACVQDRWYIGK